MSLLYGKCNVKGPTKPTGAIKLPMLSALASLLGPRFITVTSPSFTLLLAWEQRCCGTQWMCRVSMDLRKELGQKSVLEWAHNQMRLVPEVPESLIKQNLFT